MPTEMTGAGTCEGMINFETDPTYYELYTVIGIISDHLIVCYFDLWSLPFLRNILDNRSD